MSELRKLLEKLKNNIVVIDGAMGTLLLDKGVRAGACLEELNITQPNVIRAIHKSYVDAGADIIETNCFGGNRIKLGEQGLGARVLEINRAGVRIAKEAAQGRAYVAGNIGPTGKLLRPMGEMTFDEAYEAFAEQARIFEEAGADFISVETMTDIGELKIAVMAAKENTRLPVIASMTFEDNGVTVTGTPPEVFVLVAQSVGADIIGANCSNGPKILLPVIKKIAKHSTKPVLVMPNAGFPKLVKGRAVYNMSPKTFGEWAKKFIKLGVNVLGGCCGTTPEHIKELNKIVVRGRGSGVRKIIPLSGFASRTKVVDYSKKPLLVGERINPTGRKLLQAEIKSGSMSMIKAEAVSQERAGADLIDVNVGVPEVDDVKLIRTAIEAVSTSSRLPVSIDSPRATVVESGLKSFIGKPLINSVTGKEDSLQKVLPLVKRFGAAVIGLCLDDSGIPDDPKGRLRIAEKIVKRAEEAGISKDDVFIDALVMTSGVSVEAPLITLEAMKLIKQKLGVKTILGISNVSHGMPERSRINAAYLKLAIAYGVDAVIVDPTDKKVIQVVSGQGSGARGNVNVLIKEFKAECEKWKTGKVKGVRGEVKGEDKKKTQKFDLNSVRVAIIDGDKDRVRSIVEALIEKKQDPQSIIDKALVPAMEKVGKRFSSGVYFLPQVISSAEAMKTGFELVKKELKGKSAKPRGTVVLATVHGDVHDIGKNIVKMLLENNAFRVVDLGKDVPTDVIIKAAKKEKANAVALSALLTTTMPEMEVVRKGLQGEGMNIPVIVGGAVVTKDYARKIGAKYAKDAVYGVDIAKNIIKAIKRSA